MAGNIGSSTGTAGVLNNIASSNYIGENVGTATTRMTQYLGNMADAINDRFDMLMQLAVLMSTGQFSDELLTKLGHDGVTIDGTKINTYATGNNVTTTTVNGATVRKIDPDALLESPGTLFLLQQIMTKLKDAMAGLQAAGATPGQSLTAAAQAFKQGLN
jgi:hypothetical protein